MSKYLLSCRCGNDVPVDVGQAGGQVVCTCGERLDVPTLRKLRHLPVARDEAPVTRASWGARQGIITLSLLAAGILAAVAAYIRLTEPTVPEFDPQARIESVERALETMTPSQGWDLWINLYRPMAERGFAIIQDPHKAAIEQQIAQDRFLERTLLVIAAICTLIAATAAFWPGRSRGR